MIEINTNKFDERGKKELANPIHLSDIRPIDFIGFPASLENLAEECSELAQASLKLARKLRGENPTPKTFNELNANLIEEMADVQLLIEEIYNSTNLKSASSTSIDNIKIMKRRRWIKRLIETNEGD